MPAILQCLLQITQIYFTLGLGPTPPEFVLVVVKLVPPRRHLSNFVGSVKLVHDDSSWPKKLVGLAVLQLLWKESMAMIVLRWCGVMWGLANGLIAWDGADDNVLLAVSQLDGSPKSLRESLAIDVAVVFRPLRRQWHLILFTHGAYFKIGILVVKLMAPVSATPANNQFTCCNKLFDASNKLIVLMVNNFFLE